MSGVDPGLRAFVCSLGTAYLRHPAHDAARAAEPADLYRSLLHVVFGRLVRSMAAARGLVAPASLFAVPPADVLAGAEPELPDPVFVTADADGLGAAYESLLALAPRVDRRSGVLDLEDGVANARRATGTWYTPPSVVAAVLDATLEPALDEAAAQPDAERALLAVTCCDPAVGSGRFLVAAARRIAARLAAVRGTDAREPLAEVVARCVFGVDIDPTALELARATLWLDVRGADVWRALRSHLRVGDALLGTTPELVRDGIPDVAYTPLPGDDREVAADRRRRNGATRHPTTLPDDPRAARSVADAWCAAFLVPKRRDRPAITQATLDRVAAGDTEAAVVPDGRAIHWPLEFPDEVPDGFRVVVGNPPFVSPLRAGAARTPRRQLVRAVSGGLGGPKADESSYFLLLAERLAAPSGRIGMVLPDSFLSASDSADVRARMLQHRDLTYVWRGDGTEFGAAVTAAITVFGPGGDAVLRRRVGPAFEAVDAPAPEWTPAGSWAPLVSAVPSRLSVRSAATLGDLCTITADYRDQYYGLRGAVHEDDGGAGVPLLTTGLIDVLRSNWGVVPTRFDHVRYTRPVVDLDLLTTPMQRWARARLTPKILVATQGAMVEPVLDPDGRYLPCVPVVTITGGGQLGLEAVAALLLAPPVFDHLRAHKLGSGLSADAIKISAADLRALPVPGDRAAVVRAARLLPALARGDALERFGDELTSAYGLPAESNPRWLATLRRGVGDRLDARRRQLPAPDTPLGARKANGTDAQEGKVSVVGGGG